MKHELLQLTQIIVGLGYVAGLVGLVILIKGNDKGLNEVENLEQEDHEK